ncbi:DMT family transporter [Streptomyces sp. NRRL S-340]|uniref:DMT family transporter n=1 Tax=Streptomyces sp. NRRL S-340 TaxID=1463901 RepID=UPI00099BCC15|nr:DMT family transporter [Streptomyces sp. NRRL S-340]
MNALLSVAFVLCWSSGFIGAKLGAGTSTVTTLLMWRFLPLALVLLAVAPLSRAAWRGLGPRDLGRQILIGALSQSGYLLSVYHAIQLGVSTGTTALIDGVQPLVAGALAGPLLRQHVSRRQWAGLWLGLAGVATVTSADAAASGSGVAWWVYLVPFLGMLSLVAATLLEGRSREPVAPRAALTIHCVTSAVLFSGLALGSGAAAPPASVSFWAATAWLVVLPTFGGYGLYWLILRRRGVTEVNTLMFLMAPVTALWGALMFGEPFGVRTALGLAAGLAAVAVVRSGTGASRSARPIRRRPGRPAGRAAAGAGDADAAGTGRSTPAGMPGTSSARSMRHR